MLVYLLIVKSEMNKIQIIKLKTNIKLSSWLNQVKIINILIQCKILVQENGIRMVQAMIIFSKQNFQELLLVRYKVVKIIIIKHKVLECLQLMEFQNQIK
jgi:hypothetical protein